MRIRQAVAERPATQPVREQRFALAAAGPVTTAPRQRRLWFTAIVLTLALIGLAASIPAVPQLYFVLTTPRGKTGVEVFLALNQLFVALVLYLFSEPDLRPRLLWLSLGCGLLGCGGLLFGGILPMIGTHQDHINVAMYASIVSRSVGIGCMALGLAPATSPTLTRRRASMVTAAYAATLVLLSVAGRRLPELSEWSGLNALQTAARGSLGILPGLTPWHWALSAVPLLLAIVAAAGAARRFAPRPLGDWLLLATVLLAWAQVYIMFWPSAYSSILTLATVLRLAFTGVLAVGAILALNRISAQQATLLASEREVSARLTDLTRLKADFSSMVAHELTTPLIAIQRSADILALDPPDALRHRAIASIQTESDLLNGLVADVQAASAIERDDFVIQLQTIPLDAIIADAAAFTTTLAGEHELRLEQDGPLLVRADAMRIGQVLHNLLSNAAKFSPEGTPITLRTRRAGDRVTVEVMDMGPGIHPDDAQRVFEKFGRGRDAIGRRVPGMGLGLYLSRRIVRSHGSDLTVAPVEHGGTVIGFTLRVAR